MQAEGTAPSKAKTIPVWILVLVARQGGIERRCGYEVGWSPNTWFACLYRAGHGDLLRDFKGNWHQIPVYRGQHGEHFF